MFVHLVAGAGGMYCGSCLHGNTLAAALRALGEDVLLVPLYTPLRIDDEDVSIQRVALGGVNVFLQQRWGLFRHTPWWLDRLLDRPGLLRWLMGRGSSTRPEQLGELTVSMLQGEQGRQRKELDKLADWLATEVRPKLIHLNNALLVGVARQLRSRLGVPVVCTLSGEDIFLEKLPEPWYGQARALLRERCAELAAMIALNRYYADFMAEYLAVPRERISVIPAGLNLEAHATPADRAHVIAPGATAPRPFTIGYLARVCPEKGLHLLAEALRLLAGDPELPRVRVRAAGYLGPADRPYLDDIQRRMGQCGLGDQFEYLGEVDRPAKIRFLQSLDVLSVPTAYRESKGLFVLEAWANGVPAVLPGHGAFPEMVEDTGGGLLFEPGNARALAAALKRMILESDFAADCGRRAQEAVHGRYRAQDMARRTLELYRELRCRT